MVNVVDCSEPTKLFPESPNKNMSANNVFNSIGQPISHTQVPFLLSQSMDEDSNIIGYPIRLWLNLNRVTLADCKRELLVRRIEMCEQHHRMSGESQRTTNLINYCRRAFEATCKFCYQHAPEVYTANIVSKDFIELLAVEYLRLTMHWPGEERAFDSDESKMTSLEEWFLVFAGMPQKDSNLQPRRSGQFRSRT